MAQNLRAFFILYVIKIKWIISIQENIEFSDMSQRPWWSSTKISGNLSFAATKIKQQEILQKEFPGVIKSWHPVAQG